MPRSKASLAVTDVAWILIKTSFGPGRGFFTSSWSCKTLGEPYFVQMTAFIIVLFANFEACDSVLLCWEGGFEFKFVGRAVRTAICKMPMEEDA